MLWEEKFKKHIADAKAILQTAERENRDLTKVESERVERHLKAAESIKRDDRVSKVIDELAGFGGSKGLTPATPLSELVKDGLRRMGAKDLTATPSLIVGVDFIGGPGPLRGGVMGPRIFSEFPQRRVGGGSVRYLRQTQTGGAVEAGQVAPGAAKPVATFNVTNVDDDIPVFALISPDIANQVLRDAAEDFERFIDTVLSASVYRALDAHAFDELNAAAIAAGNTQAFATSPQVTLRKAVTQLEVDGFEATHVFVHPTEHEALALATDAENRYYFRGPEEADVPRAWSMKLVSSPAVDAGVAVVTAAPISAIAVLREDVELAVDTISGFNVNESRIRAELRGLLAVTAPNAIISVDLTAA